MQAEDLSLALNLDYAREIDYQFPEDVLKMADQFVLNGEVWVKKGSE